MNEAEERIKKRLFVEEERRKQREKVYDLDFRIGESFFKYHCLECDYEGVFIWERKRLVCPNCKKTISELVEKKMLVRVS